MPVTPVPTASMNAASPTSRAVFRSLAKAIGATNREADGLRHQALAASDDDALARRLTALDADDPDGDLGVEARLAVWFDDVDPDLDEMSPELASRLASIVGEGDGQD
ncbi:MAG: hypothetical protein OSA99_20835 [Acidimicrobiales bacterium]|nr:hypothetical protein [Acidimicrobiales bacterium]